MDLAKFKQEYPAIYSAVLAEGVEQGKAEGIEEGKAVGLEEGLEKGRAEGKTEGASLERERIKSVEEQLIPGHEKLISELKFDGTTSGEQAAVKILQAEKGLRQATAAALAADGIGPVDHVPAPAEGSGTQSMPEGPEKWEAEFKQDGSLQREFKTSERYVAYKQGVSQGRVKILGRKVI